MVERGRFSARAEFWLRHCMPDGIGRGPAPQPATKTTLGRLVGSYASLAMRYPHNIRQLKREFPTLAALTLGRACPIILSGADNRGCDLIVIFCKIWKMPRKHAKTDLTRLCPGRATLIRLG
jgi:hypothetical protein